MNRNTSFKYLHIESFLRNTFFFFHVLMSMTLAMWTCSHYLKGQLVGSMFAWMWKIKERYKQHISFGDDRFMTTARFNHIFVYVDTTERRWHKSYKFPWLIKKERGSLKRTSCKRQWVHHSTERLHIIRKW